MEIKNEEEEDEQPDNEKEEDKSTAKPLSPNAQAEANIASMKAENDRMEKNILAMQEMKAAEMLGGTSDAGQAPAEKKEQSDEEYAQKVMAGETPG